MKLLNKLPILLVIIAISGCGSEEKKENSPKVTEALLTVEGEIAHKVLSENMLRSTGTTVSNEEINIQSEINGRIIKIYFEEGSSVKKGEVLVKLDDVEIRALLQKSILEKKLLEDKEKRQVRLLEIKAISQEEYDALVNSLDVLSAHISMLKAQIQRTEIRAPFNGIIGLRNVSEGAIVSPLTLIASLQNFSPIKLDFSVPEKYAGQIDSKTRINYTVEGYEQIQTATVYAIEPKIDPITRSLKIRAISPNKDHKILPGSFANIEIQLGKAKLEILVPTQAVIPDINGAKVFILKNAKAMLTEVTIGNRSDTRIKINSGINEGDTVLTSGILQLKSGMRVMVNLNDNPEEKIAQEDTTITLAPKK
ncbi:MAG: efflux RND transporter periplasmic adaptor subunit [Bacteroidota bacterium]|nr:efflux RND transporter periplasmic adaptor subunit [Bacteroidota bacterium]